MRSIIFLVIVYIVKWIIDEISKPEAPDVDQIINSITEKKPIKYISNGVELKTTLKRHYFNILDLEKLAKKVSFTDKKKRIRSFIAACRNW